MGINFFTIIFTLLNIVLIGGLVFLIIRFIKSMGTLYKRSDNIDKKLDRVLESFEKDKIN